jgi:hypothetical protein
MDVGAPFQHRALRAVVDACGVLHAVYDHWDSTGGKAHLDYLSWHDGWSEPVHLFPMLQSTNGALGISPDGQPILVFLGQPAEALPTAPITTYRSELRHIAQTR